MAEKKLRFKARLEGEANNSTAWLNPPFDVFETFGTRARVPVRGTINGFPFRSSLMPMGGCHGMAINKTMRAGAKAGAGDVVEVLMERDAEPRMVEAPEELKKELKKSKAARERWDELAFTHKKEITVWILAAKHDETKKRRVAKAMQVLKTGARWSG